jgi:hypothetical protein
MTFLAFIATLSAKLHGLGFNPAKLDDHLMIDAWEDGQSIEDAVTFYINNVTFNGVML